MMTAMMIVRLETGGSEGEGKDASAMMQSLSFMLL